MDITGRGGVLASLQPRAELPLRNQPGNVVGTHEGLRHPHNGLVQRGLTVVVSRVLRHVSCELGHTDLVGQVPLESRIQDLALRRLQPVHHGGNRALQIVVREVDQVLVDKVAVGKLVSTGNQSRAVVALEPVLAVIGTGLVEGQVDCRVRLCRVVKLDGIDLGEVVLGLVARRGTQSLVVLDLPGWRLSITRPPLLVLVLRVEHTGVFATLPSGSSLSPVRLHDGRGHVGEEPGDGNELVPELVEQVHQQTADVAAIQVLVSHDHHGPVAQVGHVRILLARRQTQNLLQLRNLLGLLHLGVGRVLHVQHLALERVDTECLTLLLAQTAQSHGLG